MNPKIFKVDLKSFEREERIRVEDQHVNMNDVQGNEEEDCSLLVALWFEIDTNLDNFFHYLN